MLGLPVGGPDELRVTGCYRKFPLTQMAFRLHDTDLGLFGILW